MKTRWWLVTALAVVAMSAAVVSSAEENERGEYGEQGEAGEGAGFFSPAPVRAPGVVPVDNTLYTESCGSCHFAYQPGLLPARSWDRMLKGLSDHFGENAELPADEQAKLRDYLMANAADTSNAKRSRRIAESIAPDEAPLRITETAYFKRQHHELSARRVKDNPDVRSFSNCAACHTRAAEGSYREGEVRIPGYRNYER